MAVPKKRKSRSKRDMRRSHDQVKMPSVSECPQCHEPVRPHHVCKNCGTYRGRTIIEKEES
ncbi:MAG: 50S ribosomal protein L32 [Deltaproteobacteria bacterium]|nr:50S ribosomal protein L32 [Deltaproteobacteria bacterium]